METQTYYQMLGLPPDATKREIESKCEALLTIASGEFELPESLVNRRLVNTLLAS